MPSALPKPTSLRTPPGVIAGIVLVSAAASALICYLVYFHTPTDVAGTHLLVLPLVNAILNGLSTIALLAGYNEIRERRIIHIALRNETELRSESSGSGPYRGVIVYPAGMPSLPEAPPPPIRPSRFGRPPEPPGDRDRDRDRNRGPRRPRR